MAASTFAAAFVMISNGVSAWSTKALRRNFHMPRQTVQPLESFQRRLLSKVD
jgi:hypothetical protein